MPANTTHHRPLRAAEPTRNWFDPFNSSATGHQRAENRVASSVGWRESRTKKLAHQFRAGDTGGRRVADTAGGGVQDAVPIPGWQSVADRLGVRVQKTSSMTGEKNELVESESRPAVDSKKVQIPAMNNSLGKAASTVGITSTKEAQLAGTPHDTSPGLGRRKRGLFDGLGFYVNGSTAPLVGDQRLKRMIADEGGRVNVHLGRRRVTHVILARQNRPSAVVGGRGKADGAGGGLAAGKMEREIRRVGGVGVKYVGVEWVLESIKAGRRLSEAGFADLKIAPRGQRSVYGMFKKTDTEAEDGAVAAEAE